MRLLIVSDDENLIKQIKKVKNDVLDNLEKEDIIVTIIDKPFEALKRIKKQKLVYDSILLKDTYEKDTTFNANQFLNIYRTFGLPKCKIIKMMPLGSKELDTIKQIGFDGAIRYPFNYMSMYGLFHYLYNIQEVDISKLLSPLARERANVNKFYYAQDRYIFDFKIDNIADKSYERISYKELESRYENIPYREMMIGKDIILLISEIITRIEMFLELGDFQIVLTYLKNKLYALRFSKNLKGMSGLQKRIELLREDLLGYARNLERKDMEDVNYLTASLAVSSIDLVRWVEKKEQEAYKVEEQ